MGQNTPHHTLDRLPPPIGKVETIETLRQANKSIAALVELKGIGRTVIRTALFKN
jgi:hypothetical protein